MYSAASISAAFGEAGLLYAKNKNRGGRSSAKGRDFEVAYGAYRIALAAAEALRDGSLGEGTSFHDQILCFVDDFVTSRPGGRTLEQLKSGSATWDGGDHPLSDDFRMQSKLDKECGVTATYRLVVGAEDRQSALEANRPADLDFVSVFAFPEGLDDLDRIDQMADLACALIELSPRAAERVVCEQVWRMILGTWAGSKGDQPLADLINAAAHGPGGVVAPMMPPYVLPEDAKKALDKIADFRFYIRKGFLCYEGWNGKQRGLAEYHCHTPEFAAFVDELVATQPADFFEFLAVLKAHV